jgi:hypothetical protein
MEDGSVKLISCFFDNVEGVIDYIHGTGLDVVLQNKQVKNLVDYVFVVEVFWIIANGCKSAYNKKCPTLNGTKKCNSEKWEI